MDVFHLGRRLAPSGSGHSRISAFAWVVAAFFVLANAAVGWSSVVGSSASAAEEQTEYTIPDEAEFEARNPGADRKPAILAPALMYLDYSDELPADSER